MYGKSSLRTSNGTKKILNLKNNSSEDCTIIGRPQSHPIHTKGPGVSSVFEVEGEERVFRNTFLTKRAHTENNSPRVGYFKSPSSKEQVNPDFAGNEFVTARMKLEMEAKQRRGVTGSPSAPVSPQRDNNPDNRLYGGRSYGVSRRGVLGNFIPPIKSNGSNIGNITFRIAGNKGDDSLDESTKKWSVLRSSYYSLCSYF